MNEFKNLMKQNYLKNLYSWLQDILKKFGMNLK